MLIWQRFFGGKPHSSGQSGVSNVSESVLQLIFHSSSGRSSVLSQSFFTPPVVVKVDFNPDLISESAVSPEQKPI